MSIQTRIELVAINAVRPYGFPPRTRRSKHGEPIGGLYLVQGHEFDFAVSLKFWSHGTFHIPGKTFGKDTTLDFDETMLSWQERIRWYAPNPYPAGPWQFLNEDLVDFADANHRDTTDTVKIGWFDSDIGWNNPFDIRRWRDVNESLVPYNCPGGLTAYFKMKLNQRKFFFAQWLVNNRNGRLTTIITDRPGLTKACAADDGGWTDSGGGGLLVPNRLSRRRVLTFTLSVGGHTATASQILETAAGVPTICKFVLPALTVAESEDPIRLQRYRVELDPQNANHFNTNG